ncbi:MAG: hypothetical protein AAFY99_09895 [Pseudomonadota bacterium]
MKQGHAAERRSIIDWLVIMVTLGLVVTLLAGSGQMLLGTDQIVAVFNEIGLGKPYRILMGLGCLAAAALLLVERWQGVGATVSVLVMVCIVPIQVMVGESVAPPTTLLVMSVLVAWYHYNWLAKKEAD